LVNEIILYYDERWKKHQIYQWLQRNSHQEKLVYNFHVLVQMCCCVGRLSFRPVL